MTPAAASTWPWERLEQSNLGSHDALISLLEPKRGERWLDVGTGSGGLALRAARAGADVVGVDVAADGVERAGQRAREEGLDVRFEVADAQRLPFPDASFDVVVSAFGVIFAASHAAAAAELARVCRPGGKLGLTLMPADSRTAAFWTMRRRYGAVGDHPAAWSERVEELLGDAFDLEVERREAPRAGEDPSFDDLAASFAPLRDLVERLAPAEVDDVRREYDALVARFAGQPASYFVAVGARR